jgi:plasmid stabilization system protein ParE
LRQAGFRPAALLDIQAAYLWYEEQQPGLGEEFLAAIDVAIESVLTFPEAYTIVHRDARRILLERFPYGLYYRIAGQQVIFVACMHGARDPKKWRSRLKG